MFTYLEMEWFWRRRAGCSACARPWRRRTRAVRTSRPQRWHRVRLMKVASRGEPSMHFTVTCTVEVPTGVALDALASFPGMKVVVP